MTTFPIIVDTWTEYERGWGSRPDGMSLHLSVEDHKAFVADFNKRHNTASEVPDEYTVADGAPRVINAPESLYQRLVDLKKQGKRGMFSMSREDEFLILAGKDPYALRAKKWDVIMWDVEGRPCDPLGSKVTFEEAKKRSDALTRLGIECKLTEHGVAAQDQGTK